MRITIAAALAAVQFAADDTTVALPKQPDLAYAGPGEAPLQLTDEVAELTAEDGSER